MFKKALRGILSALTTPEAVQAEKSLAVMVLIRLALFVPAVAVYIDLIVKALGGEGVQP